MNRLGVILFVLLLAVGIVIVGCGGYVAGTTNGSPAAPSITTQPASQMVTVGQTATFTVVATGSAPLSYQWKKNGTAISGATSLSYTTPPTTSADNGSQFTVVVTNSAGYLTSSAATLTVSAAPVAPSITAEPTNQTVMAGQTATFTVVATGTAPLSYQWKKNGAAISGAMSSSYTTPATTSADNGSQFTVVVSNVAGSATSIAATLTVTAAAVAPSITTEPASQTVTVGQTATFTVVATGTAPLSYRWMKNGTAVSGATSSGYTTPATTSADNGAQFTVTVSNTEGSATSSAATLTVSAAAVAPSITTQPVSQTVTAGQTATFTVVAAGTPPLSYRWMKRGTTILGATSSSYTTPATTSADNGSQFTVVVSNIASSVTSSPATLTVNPAQPLQITTTSLPSGQVQTSYSASVQATGGTPPYAWSVTGQLPNGLSLSPSNGTITGTPSVAGTFMFTIQVKDNAGGSASASLSINIGTTVMPAFGHVAIVVLENTNYADMVGNSAMPYFNSLINQYGLATQYYANTHPSIGNYFMMTTGQILTNDDGQTPSSFPVSTDNVVRDLLAAGKTWKAYAEDLPSVGYTGGNTGRYAVRHNPLAYMTDVQNSSVQVQNLVPFTQLAADLAAGNLPNYSFIVPNLCSDGHDCPITTTSDPWLQHNIDPLIKNPVFQKDGLLIIVCDESGGDNTNGGGRIPAVLVSPAFSLVDYKSTTLYQHQSVLRLMLEGLGVNTLPGAASTAPAMWEFF